MTPLTLRWWYALLVKQFDCWSSIYVSCVKCLKSLSRESSMVLTIFCCTTPIFCLSQLHSVLLPHSTPVFEVSTSQYALRYWHPKHWYLLTGSGQIEFDEFCDLISQQTKPPNHSKPGPKHGGIDRKGRGSRLSKHGRSSRTGVSSSFVLRNYVVYHVFIVCPPMVFRIYVHIYTTLPAEVYKMASGMQRVHSFPRVRVESESRMSREYESLTPSPDGVGMRVRVRIQQVSNPTTYLLRKVLFVSQFFESESGGIEKLTSSSTKHLGTISRITL